MTYYPLEIRFCFAYTIAIRRTYRVHYCVQDSAIKALSATSKYF